MSATSGHPNISFQQNSYAEPTPHPDCREDGGYAEPRGPIGVGSTGLGRLKDIRRERAVLKARWLVGGLETSPTSNVGSTGSGGI